MKIETCVTSDGKLIHFYCESRKDLLKFAKSNEHLFGDFKIERLQYGYALFID